MQNLKRINLVQFFLYEAESFEIDGDTSFLGPNGTGKTVLLDAVQIAMLGGHGHYVHLNAQKEGSNSKPRRIMDYCLGMTDSNLKREVAQSYICLVFEDTKSKVCTSIGISMVAARGDSKHETKGMFVARGCDLEIGDFLEGVDGGQSPLRWEDFRVQLRKRGDAIGVKPQFHDTPESFVSEMLGALCSVRRIDAKAYMSAFKKSLALRSLDDGVDKFVREFLIDAKPINRQAAAAQIQRFQELRKLVEDTKAQIAELEKLESDFRSLKNVSERATGYTALAATLQYEHWAEKHGFLKEEVEDLERQDTEGQRQLTQLKERLQQLEADEKAALAAVHASEPLKAKQQAEEALEQLQRQLQDYTRPIERIINNIDQALSDLLADQEFNKNPAGGREVTKLIKESRDHLTAKRLSPAKEKLTAALHAARQMAQPLESLVDRAKTARDRADEDLKSLEASRRQSDKYGVALSNDTARAIERLEFMGITATPVCSLVKVTDTTWQPAIESFLLSNREALVVPADKHINALDMLLKLSGSERLPGAALVNEARLDSAVGKDTNPDFVGSLISGSDPIAVSFLRNILSRMRKAYSSADLRNNSRALTADGGLSANFTTKTIRMLSPAQLMFGKKYEPSDRGFLERQIDEARRIAEEARRICERRVKQRDTMTSILNVESVVRELEEDFKRLGDHFVAVETKENLINSIDVGSDEALFKAQLRATKLRRDAELEKDGLLTATGGATESLKIKRESLDEARQSFDRAKDRLSDAQKDTDYSAQAVDELRTKFEESQSNVAINDLIQECERRATTARRQAVSKSDDVMELFRAFVDRYEHPVIDERKSWRLAMKFGAEALDRLKGTTLAEREQEAAEAQLAAEENFRSGVAITIAGAIDDMRRVLKEMNGLLATSPEFAHNERYQFQYEPRPQYEALIHYITTASRPGAAGLFDSEVMSKTIMDMLLAPETGVQTPLDDFRMLFSFDVLVMANGVKRAKLSDRVHTGSGGEHKVPFYLIAGSALAHAYQLDRNAGGPAIILIDEAFNKVDPGNTLSAHRYLKSLGLQLIMTAPEDSYGKLMPVTDRIYEMQRFGDHIFLEATHIKPKAKELMRSDMVQEHPDLLDQKLAERTT
ncbi:SbcC/MukB-like Walker B domain-containing protein [Stenotrophobium rhamnosiphilum]|uniref:Chromosome segregation protein SMC n=1 Tax=Stenotrophobium rhamnosiphilum TaxID=2029166 RepID=A0A2T5MBN2_9GAMM|nr:SbcC/MukB-like Walker B domain-containing protein [Stenotrophobium rhamnosiphilum]PTU29137.1 hypothetical protein CJD38_17465 [Stenotrophobium rhamnosiphilum]